MPLAPWPVAVPLAAAALLAAAGKKLPTLVADLIALGAAAVSALSCALLLRAAARAPVIYWFGGIRPRAGVALGIDFAIDATGAGLALLSSILVFCALTFSLKYFEKPAHSFQAMMLTFLAGLCGFSLTGDLFDLFVFFELMGAAAFGLVAYKSREVGPLQGAVNFAVTNTIGAFLTLIGIALLYGRTGALNLSQIARMLAQGDDPLVRAGFALACTGFLVKSAAVPFHFWLADAHAAAPTPVCIVLSGSMVEAGLYAVARIYGAVFSASLSGRAALLTSALLAFGAVTCLVGAAMCWAQRHLKRLLAFSTISHAGVVLCGLALLEPRAWTGASLYVVGHGFVKAGLFLCAGMLLHRLQSVDELSLYGRGRGLPLLGLLFAALGFLLAGAPYTSLFAGDAALHEALEGHAAVLWPVRIASVVTGAAVLRACGRIFLGIGPREPDAPAGGEPDEEPETKPSEIPWSMWAPALALLLLAVASSWVPAEAAGRSARRMLDAGALSAQVLDGAPPADVAAPPHEKPPLKEGLVNAGAALLLAALALGRKRLPAAVRSPLRAVWDPLARGLRALHTGEVGDQVAWLTLGAALFGGVLQLLH